MYRMSSIRHNFFDIYDNFSKFLLLFSVQDPHLPHSEPTPWQLTPPPSVFIHASLELHKQNKDACPSFVTSKQRSLLLNYIPTRSFPFWTWGRKLGNMIWDISSDIPNFWQGDIRSRDAFRSIACEQNFSMNDKNWNFLWLFFPIIKFRESENWNLLRIHWNLLKFIEIYSSQ